MPPSTQKCTEELKLRVPEDLQLALMRLAAAEDRSLSDYVRTVLANHAFGHVRKVMADAEDR